MINLIFVLIISLIICYSIAELFGRSRHIGKWWAFLLLISGLIPGLIAIFLSPFATKSPTKGKLFHKIFAWIFLVIGIFGLIALNPASISFISISIYMFYLSKSLIINTKPKFYFKLLKNNGESLKNNSKWNSNVNINDLEALYESGILSEKEFQDKKLKVEQKTLINKNLESLQKLYDSGLIDDEEYNEKIRIIDNENLKYEIIKKRSKFLSLPKILGVLALVLILFAIFYNYDTNFHLFDRKQHQFESVTHQENISESSMNQKNESILDEKPKIKKYIVFSFNVKETDIFHLQGTMGQYTVNGYEEGRAPFTMVQHENINYTSDIIEVSDYDEDKLFYQRDLIRNNILFRLQHHDEIIKQNLITPPYNLSRSEAIQMIKKNGSEIIDEKIFEFDTYKEASAWKSNQK